MTRSLTLLTLFALAVSANSNLFANDGRFSASRSGCGCATNGSSAYLPSGNNYYAPGRCGIDGCSPRDSRRDQFSPQYQPRSRYEPARPQARRTPSIPNRMEGIAKLAVNDQYAALQQRICPVTRQPLGSMGTPIRVRVAGRSVFVCCEGCIKRLQNDPQRYLANAASNSRSFDRLRDDFSRSPRRPQPSLQISREMEGVALLPASEQEAALRQRTCPVTKQPLGSMGKPLRVSVAGQSVFVCCEGCVSRLKSNPAKYLRTGVRPVATFIR